MPLKLFFLIVFLAYSCASSAGPAIDVQSERIMEVILSDSTLLDSAMLVYYWNKDWMIPLGRISDAVGFSIKVSAALSQAEGFVLNESNSFYLDASKCVLRYRKLEPDCSQITVFQDDIYFSRQELERIFPIRIAVNPNRSQIVVYSKETLPIEAKKERGRLAQRSKGLTSEFDPHYPRLGTPHYILDGFFVDQQLSLAKQSGTTGSAWDGNYLTQIGGEVGGLEAYAFSNGNFHSQNSAQLTFSRRDPDGERLGPFRIREAQFLDISMPSLPLIAMTVPAKGFVFSTFPLDVPSTFEYHDFDGILLPGWEVALYRNDVLLDRQEGNSSGRYYFKNIPLIYGQNIFRFSFFGPKGERMDEFRTFNVGPDLLRPGESSFRLGLGETRDHWQRMTFQYSQNMAKYFMATAAALYQPNPAASYASLGATALTNILLLNGVCAASNAGSSACQMSAQAAIGTVNVGTRYTGMFNGFKSDLYNAAPNGPLQDREVAASLNYILPAVPGIGMDWEVAGNHYVDNSTLTTLKSITSMSFGHFLVNNTVSYGFNISGPWSGRAELMYLEASIRYVLAQEFSSSRSTSTSANVEYVALNDLSVGGGISYSYDTSRPTLLLNATKFFRGCSLGANLTAQDLRQFTIGATVAVSLGREPRENTIQFSAKPLVQSGSASVRVFIDKHRTGKFEPGDTPLAGKEITLNQNDTGIFTDANGIAFIPNLRPHTPSDITLSSKAIVDPFLRLAQPGARIMPRAGKTSLVDLPVIVVGEVDGSVDFTKMRGIASRSGLEVQLIDGSHKIAAVTKTDNYGYYVFDQVAPGRYTIRISGHHLSKLKAASSPVERDVIMSEDGAFVTNQNFKLVK